MFDRAVDDADRALMSAILAETGGKVLSDSLTASLLKAGEWAQVAIEALLDAVARHQSVEPDLVQQALDRWPHDMGPVVADEIRLLIPA
ncbi:MAG: hypothetical protein FWF36_04480 [Propionibacteriaceae bacterium]|nr:hypothetical protein [Propionibacteriaceae bacterium]